MTDLLIVHPNTYFHSFKTCLPQLLLFTSAQTALITFVISVAVSPFPVKGQTLAHLSAYLKVKLGDQVTSQDAQAVCHVIN